MYYTKKVGTSTQKTRNTNASQHSSSKQPSTQSTSMISQKEEGRNNMKQLTFVNRFQIDGKNKGEPSIDSTTSSVKQEAHSYFTIKSTQISPHHSRNTKSQNFTLTCKNSKKKEKKVKKDSFSLFNSFTQNLTSLKNSNQILSIDTHISQALSLSKQMQALHSDRSHTSKNSPSTVSNYKQFFPSQKKQRTKTTYFTFRNPKQEILKKESKIPFQKRKQNEEKSCGHEEKLLMTLKSNKKNEKNTEYVIDSELQEFLELEKESAREHFNSHLESFKQSLMGSREVSSNNSQVEFQACSIIKPKKIVTQNEMEGIIKLQLASVCRRKQNQQVLILKSRFDQWKILSNRSKVRTLTSISKKRKTTNQLSKSQEKEKSQLQGLIKKLQSLQKQQKL